MSLFRDASPLGGKKLKKRLGGGTPTVTGDPGTDFWASRVVARSSTVCRRTRRWTSRFAGRRRSLGSRSRVVGGAAQVPERLTRSAYERVPRSPPRRRHLRPD